MSRTNGRGPVARRTGRRTARRTAVSAVTAGVAAGALLLGGCSSGGGKPSPIFSKPGPSTSSGAASSTASGGAAPPSAPGTSAASPSATNSAAPATGTAKVTGTLATGLKSPWDVIRLPDGALLVGSRDTGRISRIDPGKKTADEIGIVPGVAHTQGGEDGLLGLAVSPDFGSDHLVYAFFSTESDNRIARLLYDPSRAKGDQLGAPDTILRGIPHGTLHNGGRIAFGPDGMLYAGTGETGQSELAQNKSSLGGKILRMTPDGQPPQDNPTSGSLVYSTGHRDVQGLAWDAQGRLWASEFGADTWDELNLIEPGKNYGWPVVEGVAHRAGYVDPVAQWHPNVASPSGIAYAAGCIWMATLRGERLWRVPLDGPELAAPPKAFFASKYGRLRTVVAGDGGTLLLSTSNTDGRGTPKAGDDRILRLAVT